jgi:hypothetical protein
MAASERACDGIYSASLLTLLFYLLIGLFCLFLLSLSLSPSARSSSHSLSLPTERRLESRLSTVCIQLLYSLSFSFPLSVPSARSFSARFHFRLNRRFGANFRLNAFGSSTPSFFLISIFRLCRILYCGFGTRFRRCTSLTFPFSLWVLLLALSLAPFHCVGRRVVPCVGRRVSAYVELPVTKLWVSSWESFW